MRNKREERVRGATEKAKRWKVAQSDQSSSPQQQCDGFGSSERGIT